MQIALRSCVLLSGEADANFTFKVLFAHRMMRRADEQGLLPHEQFARRGRTPNDGTLCKNWHWDYHRTMHINHACVLKLVLVTASNAAQPSIMIA